LSFNHVRKADEPIWNWGSPKFLRFQCADLNVVKDRHEIGGDLGDFFFGRGLRNILLIRLENVFQCAAIWGCTSIPEQFYSESWNRQDNGKKQNQNKSHGPEPISSSLTRFCVPTTLS
jgi:hypothetical protein